MRIIKAAAGVVNQTPLDWAGNHKNIVRAIKAARDQQASLLCLPELCITGYGCEDAFHSPNLQETAIQILMEIVPETKGIAVSLGLPIYFRGGLFNTACFVVNGRIAGFVGKQNLAGEGLHYEPRWFKPWPSGVASELTIDGTEYPLGDLIFEAGGLRIGFEICEDAWVANRPGGRLAIEGVDILLNPSASHFAFGKHEVRRRFVLDGSRAFNCVYVYANLLGNEAGRSIYDGDAMIASCGKMLSKGPRFSFEDFCLTTTTVDMDRIRVGRSRTASYRPDVDDDDNCIDIGFSFPVEASHQPHGDGDTPYWEEAPHKKEEEFTRAIALGLFDYVRKSRSRGFVVSLSGGADSAAVASLCALMVQLGVNEIGMERFTKKLSYIATLADCEDAIDLCNRLLTCVYQATRNSSSTTRNAAKTVALALGSQYFELDVDGIVQDYVQLIENAIERELSWEQDDLSLQNIQARARGPSVWLIANLTGSLLLSTSNRSEAAVGYATMDGDTCGGLSPIAGIDKAFLREWLGWLEKIGPVGIGNVSALKAINDQQPTAELRPLEKKQTDEEDLMPYEILDAIERESIRDKKSPVEVLLAIENGFSEYSLEQLGAFVERFFRLWCRNQWKRERYAPSFHVDDENLDPKTWCRFPILSGGYERELTEMYDLIRRRSEEKLK